MKRIGTVIVGVVMLLIAQAAQAAWGTSTRLTWSAGSSGIPALAIDSADKLHLVWQDDTPGNSEIFYKKSLDGGLTWTAGQRLTSNLGSSLYPAIAVDSSANLHAVWTDDTPGNFEIYYKKSTDGGSTWTTGQRLTSNSGSSRNPAIAVDSTANLHLVWEDQTPGNWEIYYRKSTDGGTSWTTSQRLTLNLGQSRSPAIAVDSTGDLHVVWTDSTPGNSEVYYKKSSDGGTSWITSQRLTFNSGYSVSPAIAVDSTGDLHVVWMDSTPGNYEIYYSKGSNGGASWTARQRLTFNAGESGAPAVAVDSTTDPHVVLLDDTPGNYEIYYKKGSKGGTSWAGQRLTWNSGYSGYPAIAVDSAGDLHVVWADFTPGNYEIYYKKGN